MAAGNMRTTDLLHLFGPLWRVAERHEYTVGQNRTHDDHAEQCEKAKVKEKAYNSAKITIVQYREGEALERI